MVLAETVSVPKITSEKIFLNAGEILGISFDFMTVLS